MKRYAILLVVLFIACKDPTGNRYSSAGLYATVSNSEQTGYKVIGIKDDDTFVLFMNGKEQVIRLAHIDCPEKKQPFGNKAKQFASDACFGKQISLIHNNNYDRNKRLIAEVILKDGRNLNKELVKNGLAWHFKRYSDDTAYAALEVAARKKRVGLWADKTPIAPWNWRRR
ncbi:thermonuclease family protein [Niabella aquatica]